MREALRSFGDVDYRPDMSSPKLLLGRNDSLAIIAPSLRN